MKYINIFRETGFETQISEKTMTSDRADGL